jgi:hypothetical protein
MAENENFHNLLQSARFSSPRAGFYSHYLTSNKLPSTGSMKFAHQEFRRVARSPVAAVAA